MELFDEIRPMIAKELSVDESEVLLEAHLQDDLAADSLALLNLSEAIAKRYNIEIENDDLVDIENIGALVQLVESRITSNQDTSR